MQILVPDPKANYRNVIHAFYRIIRYEGILRTVRGINATVYGAGPAHALYYASYEKIKALLSRVDHSNHLAHGQLVLECLLQDCFAGATTTRHVIAIRD
jgi:solute carrier family 25 (mitochondrial iron transporter), member 28/37